MTRKALRQSFGIVAAILMIAGTSPARSESSSDQAGEIVTMVSDGKSLTGLLSPKNKSKHAPLAILIQGTGATDRDGNSPAAGLNADSLKMLSLALNADGIQTFRADKRGQFSNKSAGGSGAITTTVLAKDVRDWADDLTHRTHRNCVWLIGHSAGSLVALIAGQENPRICGVISLAGAGRPFGVLVRAQFKANPGNAPVLDDAFRIIADLEAGKTVDVSNVHPALRAVFSPASQPVWIDLFSYDPAKLAKGLHKPILIIQGDNDLQISLEDADALASAIGEKGPFVVPGMNHILKIAPTDSTQNLATYGNATLPLAPGIEKVIAAFIKGPHRLVH